MTVLIADDEYQSRVGLAEGLEWAALGFERVLTASDGAEAWALYQEHHPEVVLTDIRMPGLDGLELVQAVRQHSADTQVIMVSGHSDFEYAKRALQLGVTDYLLKPVKLKELVAVITLARSRVLERGALTGSPVINLALEYVKNHWADDLSVEQVATVVQKSPNYFSHLFKKETGASFTDHLNRLRIAEAKNLLKTTTLLAYEVAERVGYRDYRYFVEVFRRREGCSPSEYRKS